MAGPLGPGGTQPSMGPGGTQPSGEINFDTNKAGQTIADFDKMINKYLADIQSGGQVNQTALLKVQQAMQNRQMFIETFTQMMKADHDTQEANLHNQK